jgi:hypothetical protein
MKDRDELFELPPSSGRRVIGNHVRQSDRDVPVPDTQSYASEIAMIPASLGDTDQAMNWLEEGFEERLNPGVLLRPGFDPLRSDPRFEDLVRRIGLPR